MDESKTKGEMTPTWIKNEHGVVSCKPQWLAKKLVGRNMNWEYTEAERTGEYVEEVSEGVVPPEAVEEEEELSFREMQVAVKEMGVNPFGKKKSALKEILEGEDLTFKKQSIKLNDES